MVVDFNFTNLTLIFFHTGFEASLTEEVPGDFSGNKILILPARPDLTLKKQIQCGRIYSAPSMY